MSAGADMSFRRLQRLQAAQAKLRLLVNCGTVLQVVRGSFDEGGSFAETEHVISRKLNCRSCADYSVADDSIVEMTVDTELPLSR